MLTQARLLQAVHDAWFEQHGPGKCETRIAGLDFITTASQAVLMLVEQRKGGVRLVTQDAVVKNQARQDRTEDNACMQNKEDRLLSS